MKYEDLVVCHSLLGHNYLLTTINNEVATLVILAIFTSSNSIILTQTMKLTELRSEHDRDLANHDSSRGIFGDDLFDLPLSLTGLQVDLIVVPVEFLLR